MLVELILLDTHRPHPSHGPDWGNVSEQIAAGASVLALLAAFAAIIVSRRIAKNTDFYPLHEFLMSSEVQRGRRLMYEEFAKGADWSKLRRKRPADHDVLNNAVSGFQRLAQYARLRYVPRGRAFTLWSGTIRRSWPAVESYIAWRRALEANPRSWDDLVWFARKSGANVTID